jgi:diguanylate cyclase (GGDEF)-like protein
VIGYLSLVSPITGEEQIVLAVDSPEYPVAVGDRFPYATSLCQRMVSGAAPQIAPDVLAVPEYAEVAAIAPIDIRAYVGIPIVRADGQLFGTVCGSGSSRQPDSLREHQPLLDLLSSLLSSVLEADLTATAFARELELARRDADTDALTGLLNRRGWDRYLEREEQRYRRFGDPACVVVFDVDHLKIVNDTAGHDAGDRYLRRAAEVLAATVRGPDVVARLGGDEFGIVMAGASLQQAGELVERMRQALHESGIAGCFGHAPYSVVSGFPGAWRAADQAMYEQKRRRRRGLDRHERGGSAPA